MSWPESVDRSQLRIDYYRGSGAGGQHRNKTSSACRITHEPTGISTSCESFRQQAQNRKRAFLKLAKLLVPIMKAALGKGQTAFVSNREQLRVRTYHEPRGTVTDHRTGVKASYAAVLDGGLEVLHGRDSH